MLIGGESVANRGGSLNERRLVSPSFEGNMTLVGMVRGIKRENKRTRDEDESGPV